MRGGAVILDLNEDEGFKRVRGKFFLFILYRVKGGIVNEYDRENS